MSKLIVIDGNSLTYRAFFAMPTLTTRNGVFTNAVFGFANILLKLISTEKPTHVLVALDAGRKTFRNTLFENYKGHRPDSPDELKSQFPLVEELVDSFGIQRLKVDGYEADDVIGTITKIAESSTDMEILVVTGDKDLLQITSPKTTIMLMKKGISENIKYTPEEFQSVYGLEPHQMIDLKGLMGDTSDNIPGIKGVGEKTALKFLHQYGSVEELFAHTSEIKGKMREKVEAGEQDARISKELATIIRDVPIDIAIDSLSFSGPTVETLAPFLERMEFRSLLDRLSMPSSSQPAEKKAVEYTLISEKNIHDLVSSLSYVKSVYPESLGENPHTAEFLGLSFHTNTKNFFIDADTMKNLGPEWTPVKEWLASERHSKYTHDLNRAKVVLFKQKMHLRGVKFDTMIAAYLIDSGINVENLSSLATEYGLSGPVADEDVYGKGAKTKIPALSAYAEHAVSKALTLTSLVPMLTKRLEQMGMLDLFHKMEMPLMSVLAKCETSGIKLDAEGLTNYGTELKSITDNLEADIYDLAGEKFGLGSTKQLSDVLFNKLGLPVIKKVKTGFSTDVDVLEKLKPLHPIIEKVLQHRQLSKLHSSFVEGVLKEMHRDGKIHTYYNPALTSTGRLSSQFPNMQNIPIRTEWGRKIRKYFVPVRPTSHILASDYSQIELRVLAHISGDKSMVSAFVNDQDIHTRTAMDVFGVDADNVTSDMRRSAKAVNFGIVYGISDYGLATNLAISRKEAEDFITRYFEVFPGVKEYMSRIVEEARENGYVTTLANRKRNLPDIKSSNFNIRNGAERMAMNTPIQGTAADIIKIAMVALESELQKKSLESKMLLQVHDELVFDVVDEELEVMKDLVKNVMESAMTLDVPLVVDINYGPTWYDAK